MAEIISVFDLPDALRGVEMVEVMVDGANAKASRVAPCLAWDGTEAGKPAPSVEQLAEARLVLFGAVKRWAEAGSGALQSQSAGIFSQTVDTRTPRRGLFQPSEVEELQAICADHNGEERAGAFNVDTVSTAVQHADWCATNFGANYCDCGAILAGYPIFGQPESA